jgi:predicted nucleotide-binding protein (sugar kinase/HSP70/actin superfamily)
MIYLLVNWLPGYAQAIRLALPSDLAARLVPLEQNGIATVLRGLAHTNNDACYSSIYAIGQVMEALAAMAGDGGVLLDKMAGGDSRGKAAGNSVSRDDSRDKMAAGSFSQNAVAVVVPHTCVDCRAGDLPGLIRKALTDAGYSRIPVFTAAELLSLCSEEQLEALARAIVAHELDTRLGLARAGESKDPPVALVGTAPALFNTTINNSVVAQIEAEGCSTVIPWYSDFILYGLKVAGIAPSLLAALTAARANIVPLCAEHNIASPLPLEHYLKVALESGLVSARETAGAGWLYVGHVLDCIQKGIRNIVYAHSFGCLPAHTIGRGIFRELRARYPELNIVSLEFDPGASSVNQSNRLKLLTSLGRRRAGRRRTLA